MADIQYVTAWRRDDRKHAAIFQARELESKAVDPLWADYNIHLNLAVFTNSDEQVRVAWFRHARMEVKGG